MYGVGLEGMIYEYWHTHNENTIGLVKTLVDHLIQQQVNKRDGTGKESQILRCTSNVAFALAYLYHVTGNPEYKEWCLKVIEQQQPTSSQEVATFGMRFRTLPRALYYVAVPPEK